MMSGRGATADFASAGAERLGAAFWNYALDLYGRNGVAACCLRLQDEAGFEVNLLLFCCFAAGCLTPLSPRLLAGLAAALEPWQAEVVTPLRRLRRQTKQPIEGDAGMMGAFPGALVEGLHRALAAAERAAEKAAQHLICRSYFDLAPTAAPAAAGVDPTRSGVEIQALARANLGTYAVLAPRQGGAGERDALLDCLAAAASRVKVS